MSSLGRIGLCVGAIVLVGACGVASNPPSTASSGTVVELPEPATASSSQATSSKVQQSWAGTPGQIACGRSQCDRATELCCFVGSAGEGSGRCVPKPSDPDALMEACCPNKKMYYCLNERHTTARSCDETADCGIGEKCCDGGLSDNDFSSLGCSDSCVDEACVAGTMCPNGNRCEVEAGAEVGQCPLQIAGPTCGGVTCALGEACCQDHESHRVRCTDVEACGRDRYEITFECTAPDQCDGHACQSISGVSDRYACGGLGFVGAVLCNDLGDCPTYLSSLGQGPGAPTATDCGVLEGMPAGVRSCIYTDDGE